MSPDGDDARERARSLTAELTLPEKLRMLTGSDFWHTSPVDRLGIPALRMTDGPHGVTTQTAEHGAGATCFPTGIGIASTWNLDLAYEVGAALAREARAKGCHVLLGPAVDIHRTPLGGRNYESYSEDPLLSGRLAASYIRGVQSEGVGAVIKHCTCNNQQTNQHQVSVEIDERSLREIYLEAFRIAVQEGRPWGIMTAYNRIRGAYCSANAHLIRRVIKGEWGFDGFVVSDWRGVHSTEAVLAGLDLEMPGPGTYCTPENLEPLLDSGALTTEEVDDKVVRILTAVVRSGLMDEAAEPPQGEIDTPRHRALAREVASQSIVMLKNDGDLLPFDLEGLKRVAVIGPNASSARLGGGGSSSVTALYSVSPLEGLRELCGPEVELPVEEGCSLHGQHPAVPARHLIPADAGDPRRRGLTGRYFRSAEPADEPVLTRIDEQVDFTWGWSSPGGGVPREEYSVRWEGQIDAPATGEYRIGVSFSDGLCRLWIGGRLVVDAWNRDDQVTFEHRYTTGAYYATVDLKKHEHTSVVLQFAKTGTSAAVRFEWEPPGERTHDAVERAARTAAGADAALVFVGLSNLYEGGNHDRESMDLPGEQQELILRIVESNPRTAVVVIGGTPVDMRRWIDRAPAVLEAWYPGQEGGRALADVLFGRISPSGRLPDTLPRRLEDNPSHGLYPGDDLEVPYAEGLFVGYRHYGSKGVDPLFAFGHGLSYSVFRYGELRVGASSGDPDRQTLVRVEMELENEGTRAGAEVVQLYTGSPASATDRPTRELRDFRRLELGPGESRTVVFDLPPRAFAGWDPETAQWEVEPGEHTIWVGPSATSGVCAALRLPHLVVSGQPARQPVGPGRQSRGGS